MSELQRLQALLAARTQPDGSPLKGYKRNVAELRRRIALILTINAWRRTQNDSHGEEPNDH